MSEVAHAEERSVVDWLRRLRRDLADSILGKRVAEQVRERLQEEVTRGEGKEAGDWDRSILDKILPRDIEGCLEEYVQQGDMKIEAGRIRITPRGGRRLASLAKKKLEKLSRERPGLHQTPKLGCGWDLDRSSRRYELGDDYRFLDIQKTLLNSLERKAPAGGPAATLLDLEEEDLEINEKTEETRMCLALLVDESASMGEEKRDAAIDTCLALARLKEPQDLLKVFIFSSQTQEIPCWEILNVSAPKETTDIKLALQTARRALKSERGRKQIYLITDAEPNTENHQYIGFEKAVPGVMKEVFRYRQEGLTLNIVMLDDNPLLKDFASRLAQFNTGRIYFASASDLGRVVIQDYLTSRRRARRGN
ncbi:MAG: hypothetical protein HYS70_04125 [Nitrospinae bacterium]|nr:hypothetical protein [Nitrospinota bacterium]